MRRSIGKQGGYLGDPVMLNAQEKSDSSNNFFLKFYFLFFSLALLCIDALFVVLSVFLAHFGCLMCIYMFFVLDALRTHYLCLVVFFE